MNKKKGVTLIELIIVISILSVVSLMLVSIFSFSINSNRKNTELVNNTDAIRLLSNTIEKDIRKSSQFISVNKNDACFEITDLIDNEKIVYCLDDGKVYRNSAFLIDYVKKIDIQNIDDEYIYIKLDDSEGNHYEQTMYYRKNEE